MRKQVWSRDGGACSFEGTDGHRCGSRHQLELHHVVPFAKGGPATVENLKLICARHNQRLAEKEFGSERVARAVAGARERRTDLMPRES